MNTLSEILGAVTDMPDLYWRAILQNRSMSDILFFADRIRTGNEEDDVPALITCTNSEALEIFETRGFLPPSEMRCFFCSTCNRDGLFCQQALGRDEWNDCWFCDTRKTTRYPLKLQDLINLALLGYEKVQATEDKFREFCGRTEISVCWDFAGDSVRRIHDAGKFRTKQIQVMRDLGEDGIYIITHRSKFKPITALWVDMDFAGRDGVTYA